MGKTTEEERERRKERRKLRKLKGGTTGTKAREIKSLVQEAGTFISVGEHITCLICERPIHSGELYRRLMPDESHPEWRFYHYPKCGPGTEVWFKFHPSRMAKLMLEGQKLKVEKQLVRRARRLVKKGGEIEQARGETRSLLTFKQKEEITMSKEKKKSKKGEHLKPMAPVVIPESIIKKQSGEVKALLEELMSLKDRSSPKGSQIRRALRAKGFKLSNYKEDNKKKEVPKKKEAKKEKVTPPEEVTEG